VLHVQQIQVAKFVHYKCARFFLHYCTTTNNQFVIDGLGRPLHDPAKGASVQYNYDTFNNFWVNSNNHLVTYSSTQTTDKLYLDKSWGGSNPSFSLLNINDSFIYYAFDAWGTYDKYMYIIRGDRNQAPSYSITGLRLQLNSLYRHLIHSHNGINYYLIYFNFDGGKYVLCKSPRDNYMLFVRYSKIAHNVYSGGATYLVYIPENAINYSL
jgi:hypothetical protein